MGHEDGPDIIGQAPVVPRVVEKVSTVDDGSTGEIAADIGERVDVAKQGEVERIDLGIDWDSIDYTVLLAQLSRYDELTEARTDAEAEEIQVFKCPLHTSIGEELIFDVTKFPKSYKGSADELQIAILRPSQTDPDKKYVAEFDFARYPEMDVERWDMKHRRTGAIYQGQGIAGRVLKMVEGYLEQRSQQKGKEQFMMATSGQMALTRWLSKRGYQPKDSEDARKLALVESDPGNLQVFSAPKEDTMGADRPQGYLFDTEDFSARFPEIDGGPANPMVWDGKNYHEPFFYMKSSLLVSVEKKIG